MDTNVERDIEYVREWMRKEPHLPEPFEDHALLEFLHSNYYSLEQTKKCINQFCTSRHNMPQIFSQRDPLSDSMKATASSDRGAVFRGKDIELMLFKLGRDPNSFNLANTCKLLSIKIDYLLMKHRVPLPKYQGLVYDVGDLSIKHLPKIHPVLFREFTLYVLTSLPVRVNKIFLINAPAYIDLFFNIVKPILPSKIIDIIFISPDDKCLETFMDKQYLPKDYGGDAETMREKSDEMYNSLVDKYRYKAERKLQQSQPLELDLDINVPFTIWEVFCDDNMWKGDAAMIPKGCGDDLHTMNGSFRTLDID